MTRGISSNRLFAGLTALGAIGGGIAYVSRQLGYNNNTIDTIEAVSGIAGGIGLIGSTTNEIQSEVKQINNTATLNNRRMNNLVSQRDFTQGNIRNRRGSV